MHPTNPSENLPHAPLQSPTPPTQFIENIPEPSTPTNNPHPPEQSSQEIPQPYTVDRYQSLWQRSPFTLPSAVVDMPIKSAGLEQKFILQSVMIIDGKPIVTLHSKDKQTSITITDEPLEEEDGLRVVSIDDSKVTQDGDQDITKLLVKIANNSEQGEISFDPAQLSQQSGISPPMPGSIPTSSLVPASIPAIPPSSSSDNGISATPTTPTPPPTSTHQRRRMVIPSTPPPSDNSTQ